MNSQSPEKCRSCGAEGVPLTRGHILPKSLYPFSKRVQGIQLPTLLECNSCNNGWSDDEDHFRTVLALAGEPNESVTELWNSKIARGLKRPDAKRRIEDLHKLIEPTKHDGEDRLKIFPARDERVLRILKKIVRGLSDYLGIERGIEEKRIYADVLKFSFPIELRDSWVHYQCAPDIFQCWYHIFNDDEISAIWLLTFYERRSFLVSVSALGAVLVAPSWS